MNEYFEWFNFGIAVAQTIIFTALICYILKRLDSMSETLHDLIKWQIEYIDLTGERTNKVQDIVSKHESRITKLEEQNNNDNY